MIAYSRLWCEWDYGQDAVIFTSEEIGKYWLRDRMIEIDGEERVKEEWPDPQTIFDEGLAGFDPVEIFNPH